MKKNAAEQELRRLETTPTAGVINSQIADKYAEKGTVKHFAFRLGFMPHNERDAELIIVRCLMDANII